jgi:hypothetical protein
MRSALLATIVVALAGCAPDQPNPNAFAPPPPVDDCGACDDCGDDCDPAGAGLECVTGVCEVTGRCACYLDTAGEDCPETGCCAAQYDDDGYPIVDEYGYPVYGCVVPWCVVDDDCATGEVCVIGATCDQNFCMCADDLPGDGDGSADEECCPVHNDWGACCETGEVDDETGLCVCSDPVLMTDDGDGCECPTGMTPDLDGQCVCADALAEYDPMTGECHCPDTAIEEIDADGVVHCTEPTECDDEYAAYDSETDACWCIDGYHMGEHEDFDIPRCIPDDDGDPDADPDEPDADEPDADEPDANLSDADADADADAGLPDAAPADDANPGFDAVPPWDAVPSQDACPTGSAICHIGVEL